MKKAVWTAVDLAASRLACVSLIAAGISMGLGVAVLLASFMIVAGHTVHPKGVSPDPMGWGSDRILAEKDSQKRTASAYFGGSLNMRMKGDLGPEPFADVPAGSPRPWLMGTLDSYDSVAADTEAILTPGPLFTVDSPALVTSATVATDAEDRFVLLGHVPVGSFFDVTSTALLSADEASDESTLRGIPVLDPETPDPIRDQYLALPSSVPERVTQLGQQLVKNSPDRLAAGPAPSWWSASGGPRPAGCESWAAE